MKCLTIIFLITSIIILFKGNFQAKYSANFLKKMLLLAEENQSLDESKFKKLITKESYGIALLFIWLLIFYIIEFFYTICATSIDIYFYPTLIYLVLICYNIVRAFLSNKKSYINNITDLQNENGRYEIKKAIGKFEKFSFRMKFKQILNVSFYGYMFYILFLLK